MPCGFFNGVGLGLKLDDVLSLDEPPMSIGAKGNGPARGQLRPSLGCTEGAIWHGSLNRKSEDCSL
jgi:hypothetical protein